MNVEGIGPGRDFKLWPGGGRAWDWNETGTRHAPGIQPSDVEELIAKGSTIVVLSQGMHRRLETSPETIEFLKHRGIEYRIAVHDFSFLRKTKKCLSGKEHKSKQSDRGQNNRMLFHDGMKC